MKLIITPADDPHTIDIGIRPGNPLYHEDELEKDGDSTYTLKASWDTIRPRLVTLLCDMPSNYLILTGIAPIWLRSNVQAAMSCCAGNVFLSDGKVATLVDRSPPMERISFLS